MYDPNDLACEIFFREAKSAMKDKALRELANRACQMADIFWTELARYAGTKPKPLAAPANVVPANVLPNYSPPGMRGAEE